MKVRLSYKIFVAFLLTAFMIVALMVGTMRFYLSRHFADYVNETALDRFDALTQALASEFRSHQGWQVFRDRPDLWKEVLRSAWSKNEREAGELGESSPPGREGTEDHESSRSSQRYTHRLARGLALFDEHKEFVTGRPLKGPLKSYTLRAITVDGRGVGWLGLHKRESLSNPLVISFLKQQTILFYEIGGGILLLAAIVAFILSKHFLAPIRQLTEGTHSLTKFDFDAIIDVRTKDELGQLAKDFNLMAGTLKKYEDMRKQWVTDISHELRTPLAILRGEIEALQDGVRAPDENTLGSLHGEVLRLSKLVDDLHLLSLADGQNLLFRKEPVYPLEILKERVNHFRPRLEERGIEVRLGWDGAENPLLEGDSDRLAQLFANLLENSLRYADSPGMLKIGEERSGGKLTIRFEDSGPGVPPEALERIFDRLYRVDKSRSRELGGSGLGLAICKQIVEAHGGVIKAANGPSGGLLIMIELPMFAGGSDRVGGACVQRADPDCRRRA